MSVCSITSCDRLTARTTSADIRGVFISLYLPHDCILYIVLCTIATHFLARLPCTDGSTEEYHNYCLACHSCRDLVHRQTACWAVKHMALGVYGFGCDDALMHLFNLVWPNIFENSPHMVQAFTDAVDGCRVALGPTIVFQYTLQVCL